MQLFNLINCRKVGTTDTNVFERFLHNWIFIVVFAATFVIQIVLVNVLHDLIGAVPISRSEWGACIFVGSTVLLIAFALKFIPAEWIGILDAGAIGLDEDNETKNQIVDAYEQYATKDVGEFVPAK